MAISAVNLTSAVGSTSTGLQTFVVTASVTTVTGRLYILTTSDDGTNTVTSITTGLGITWTAGSTVTNSTGEVARMWYGVCSAGATGTIQINTSAIFTNVAWVLDEISGADTVSPVVQSAVAAATTTSPITVTLAAFGSVNNGAYAIFHNPMPISQSVTTKEGTWTNVSSNSNVGNTDSAGFSSTLSEYIATNDTTPSATFVTTFSPSVTGIAVEIKALALANNAFTTTVKNSLTMMGCGI